MGLRSVRKHLFLAKLLWLSFIYPITKQSHSRYSAVLEKIKTNLNLHLIAVISCIYHVKLSRIILHQA